MGRAPFLIAPAAAGGVEEAWHLPLSYIPVVDTTGTPVTVTSGGSSHTKGAWVELVASTPADGSYIGLSLSGATPENGQLLDVGFGPSGSETVVIPNVGVGSAKSVQWAVPLRVPSGTRIAGRTQSEAASDVIDVGVALFDYGDASLVPTDVDTYGSDVATSKGLRAPADSSGYKEVTASTSRDYSALSLAWSFSTNLGGRQGRVYVAVGPAGAEVDIGRIFCTTATAEVATVELDFSTGAFPYDVPAGSRIAVRTEFDSRQGDVTIIGVPT